MRISRSRVLAVLLVVLALAPATAGQAVPDRLTQQLEQARDRLAELDTQVSMAVEDANAAAVQLERLQTQQQQTAGRVDALTAEVTELEDATDAFVRSMYMRGPRSNLAMALENDEVTEAGRDLAVMDRLSRQRQGQLERLAVSRTELEAARSELATQVEAAAERERELADQRERVEAMLADQKDEVASFERRDRAHRGPGGRRGRQTGTRSSGAPGSRRTCRSRRQAAAERAAAPKPEPAPPPPAPAAPPPGTRQGANQAVQAALSQVGKPYRYAAAGPDAYDCSGLTMWAWRHAGVSLPHSSRMQYAATTRISRDQLQAGDLVFYGSPIHHVAMYLDGTRVVEAPYTGANVRVRSDGLLRSDIVGYGRP